MRVYTIAADECLSLLHAVFSDRNVQFATKDVFYNGSANSSAQTSIVMADLIVVYVNERFVENEELLDELKIAVKSVTKRKKQTLFPMICNGASIPPELEGRAALMLNKGSEIELSTVRRVLNNMLPPELKWSNEEKHEQSKKASIVPMAILTVVLAVVAIVILVLPSSPDKMDPLVSGVLVVVTSGLCLGMMLIYIDTVKKRKREYEENEIEAYSRKLQRAMSPEEKQLERKSLESIGVPKEEKKEVDALGRMMINLEDIKEFYTWSQKQAKAAFVLAVCMCIVGFLLMVTAVLLPAISSLSFEMALIPAAGGAIAELVAGTALVVYKNSLAQLNHYHKALHEDERFLSSVNLLGKFSTPEAQDDMLREIIRSEIEMNLSEVREEKIPEPGKKRE